MSALSPDRIDHADVLVVIAHPDDELFVSGTICLCREAGFGVDLICVTDGEGGARGLLHSGDAASRLGEIRRLEVTLSAWALGVDRVSFLGQEDIPPEAWGAARCWDEPAVIAALAARIEQLRPRLILTHGPLGGYGHPAHCSVGRCVLGAADAASFDGSIFSFGGQLRNSFFSWRFDQPSHVAIDARGFLRRRVASLSYHQSEAQFFLGPFFPRTVRQFASALFGFLACLTEAGRKRMPVITADRFFRRFPFEGLVLQRAPTIDSQHFFAKHFSKDKRVCLLGQPRLPQPQFPALSRRHGEAWAKPPAPGA